MQRTKYLASRLLMAHLGIYLGWLFGGCQCARSTLRSQTAQSVHRWLRVPPRTPEDHRGMSELTGGLPVPRGGREPRLSVPPLDPWFGRFRCLRTLCPESSAAGRCLLRTPSSCTRPSSTATCKIRQGNGIPRGVGAHQCSGAEKLVATDGTLCSRSPVNIRSRFTDGKL